ncbi:MAG: hypothetical protein ACI8QC_002079, partial [Planctomycetota bacterium]
GRGIGRFEAAGFFFLKASNSPMAGSFEVDYALEA